MKRKPPPIIVKKPKRRIPVPPPEITHRDRKRESKLAPSGRRAKHKKPPDQTE